METIIKNHHRGTRRMDTFKSVPKLEEALAARAGKLPTGFSRQWLAGVTGKTHAAWIRAKPAWCPLCVIGDVQECGEVYSRREWRFGGYLICPKHNCLLISECPRCFAQAKFCPIDGRLRIWCPTCETCADTILKAYEIPFWPYGTPQQRRSCVTVSLSSEARTLLLRVQSDLLAILGGARVRATWARFLRRARLPEVLCKLIFVMLGPLWEDNYRPVTARNSVTKKWTLPDDWTPGLLPPEIAAPALLASVTFLAAENSVAPQGITWNKELLLPGESEFIATPSLVWHLAHHDAALVIDFFAAQGLRGFALLIAALRADKRELGRTRETRRRRAGIGGGRRRLRQQVKPQFLKNSDISMPPIRPSATSPDPGRFSLSKVFRGYPSPKGAPIDMNAVFAADAVYGVLGAIPFECDWPEESSPFSRFLGNRYVRNWIFHNSSQGAVRLISILAAASATASAKETDIVLPDLPSS